VLTDAQTQKKLRLLEKSLPKPKRIRIKPTKIRKKWFLRFSTFLFAVLSINIVFSILIPPFIWPVKGPITSEFLFRYNPSIHKYEIHRGIDLGVPIGTAISSSSIGIVSDTGTTPTLGNYIVVTHILGFSTLYAHLQKKNCKVGEIVLPGFKPIGFSGSTGKSTGPHLHFSIRIAYIPLSPRIMLFYHDLHKKVFRK
jgi:murein DD-endopeptidase MepM/ murein hydrolase activator NlpD